MFILELEEGVFKAAWSGDPGRTLDINNAKKYKTEKGAKVALEVCKKYPWREFPNAKIIKVG